MRASKRGKNWLHMSVRAAFQPGDVPYVNSAAGDCLHESDGRKCLLSLGHVDQEGKPTPHAMPFMRGSALRHDRWPNDGTRQAGPRLVEAEEESIEPALPDEAEAEPALQEPPDEQGEAKPKRKKAAKKKAAKKVTKKKVAKSE